MEEEEPGEKRPVLIWIAGAAAFAAWLALLWFMFGDVL
jgi:Mg2+ and Co2+ transporter CorA